MIKAYTLPEKIVDVEVFFTVRVNNYNSAGYEIKEFSEYKQAEKFICQQLATGYGSRLSIEKYYRRPKES